MRDGDGHYEEFSSVLCLCEAEALSSLVDGEQQLLAEHFIRRVLRKIDLVEACDEEMSVRALANEGLRVYDLQVCACGRRSVSPYALCIEKR